eukprot:CAMPEP_0182444636 /NCGR_PEP_ID=MMETSP1172-20130603/3033_1 /TAXON_ID=708627 /ORGANISM="Timspurckia oligopyrenoides, Strain CCMP3278" /LENGTH=171 /DNA_ID=CAMNT_0024640245 /DNA_START=66 /DNA_END=581 /DNA_ORIENTATION=+
MDVGRRSPLCFVSCHGVACLNLNPSTIACRNQSQKNSMWIRNTKRSSAFIALQMSSSSTDNETKSSEETKPEAESNKGDFYDGPGPGMRQLSEAELGAQKAALVGLSELWKKQRLTEEAEMNKLFGWTRRAETLNGRVAMFFFVTGLLTEYWTGESVPDQIETLLRTLGVI